MKIIRNNYEEVASGNPNPSQGKIDCRGKTGISSVSSARKPSPKLKEPEHEVVVHFQYGSKDVKRLFDLHDMLENSISKAKAGEFDRNDVVQDRSDVYLHMYGPDADNIFDIVRPILEATEFTRGASVKLYYGRHHNLVREVKRKIKN